MPPIVITTAMAVPLETSIRATILHVLKIEKAIVNGDMVAVVRGLHVKMPLGDILKAPPKCLICNSPGCG